MNKDKFVKKASLEHINTFTGHTHKALIKACNYPTESWTTTNALQRLELAGYITKGGELTDLGKKRLERYRKTKPNEAQLSTIISHLLCILHKGKGCNFNRDNPLIDWLIYRKYLKIPFFWITECGMKFLEDNILYVFSNQSNPIYDYEHLIALLPLEALPEYLSHEQSRFRNWAKKRQEELSYK